MLLYVVRPGKPRQVSLQSTGPRSLQLHYKIPHELDHFPPGLRTEIKYRSEFDREDYWTEYDTSDIDRHRTEATLELDGLYPYAMYTVQVRLQSQTATEDRLWSDVTKQEARTEATVPFRAPTVAQGSFEIVGGALQSRRIYVYWQQIEPEQKNGPDFHYKISEVFEAGLPR